MTNRGENTPMRLLFIGYLHGYGGAEKMITQLSNQMCERGHEVSFLTLSENNPKYEINKRITKFSESDRKSNKIINILRRRKKVKDVIGLVQPDLIINFWLQSAYLCATFDKNISSRTIYAERGDPSDTEYDGLLGVVRKITFNRIRSIIFQSKKAKEYFDLRIQKKSIVIYNAVNVDKTNLINDSKIENRIISVGRLHKQKNQQLLIKAFNIVHNKYPNYYLDIFGEGKLKGELQKLIDDFELSDFVFLKGTSNEIHKEMYSSSMFVLSSDYEGMPNALIEAMALGIPCITTNYKPGSASEIIDDGVSGIIVPMGSPEKLADAIIILIENADLKRKFSINGQKKIQAYSPQIIFDKWENYFNSLTVKNDESIQ